MFHLSRRTKIFLVFLAIVLGGSVVGRFGFSSATPSEEFKNARYQGAIVAQDIVNFSNQTTADLESVNKLDREHKYREAFDATTELLKRSEEVRKRALDLSTQLEKMTGGLATVKSAEARQAALESITSRLAVIGRLLSYSDYLSQLLATLRDRFAGRSGGDKEVATLIVQINAEVTAINNFNRQAGQAMDRFDQIVKGQ